MKDLLKVQLDRITPERLEDYINFIQTKLNEQKSLKTRDILSKISIPFLTPQIMTQYAQISVKEGLTFLDCFDPNNSQKILALHESCYSAFSGLYDNFLYQTTQKKWGNLSPEELNKNFIAFLEKMTNSGNQEGIAITYEIARNLNEFPFKSFLRFESLNLLKNKLFEGLKGLNLFTLIDEKYIETSSLDRHLFPSDYKKKNIDQDLIKGGPFVLVPENSKYAIWGLLKDHIRVVVRTSPAQQKTDLFEVMEIFQKIEEIFNGGFKFNKNYGYLSENVIDLGYNLQFTIEAEVNIKKREVLKQFCKTLCLGYEEKLEGKECLKIKIISRKPTLLDEDLEMMANLLKGLNEIE